MVVSSTGCASEMQQATSSATEVMEVAGPPKTSVYEDNHLAEPLSVSEEEAVCMLTLSSLFLKTEPVAYPAKTIGRVAALIHHAGLERETVIAMQIVWDGWFVCITLVANMVLKVVVLMFADSHPEVGCYRKKKWKRNRKMFQKPKGAMCLMTKKNVKMANRAYFSFLPWRCLTPSQVRVDCSLAGIWMIVYQVKLVK